MTRDKADRSQGGEGHARLGVFVGEWHTKGRQIADTVGPAADISAVETYEWLAGGKYLIHRFHGQVGDGDASCVEIVGFDAAGDRFPVHTFYNNGLHNEWTYREQGGAWTLTGEFPGEGGPMHVRNTVRFGAGGDTLTGKWEQSKDGADWQTFWEVEARRVTPAR